MFSWLMPTNSGGKYPFCGETLNCFSVLWTGLNTFMNRMKMKENQNYHPVFIKIVEPVWSVRGLIKFVKAQDNDINALTEIFETISRRLSNWFSLGPWLQWWRQRQSGQWWWWYRDTSEGQQESNWVVMNWGCQCVQSSPCLPIPSQQMIINR